MSELGFMGKKWDKTGIAFNLELWKECLRVIKPGGNLLSFGGTRTYHRMVCAIEDAGFEIRDCIMWVYGSGFPKSLDISKALDRRKAYGNPLIFGKLCETKRKALHIGITEADRLITGGTNNYRVWIEHGYRLPRWEQYLKIKELYHLDNSWDNYMQEAERKIIGRPLNYSENRKKHNWCGKPAQWATSASTPEAKLWEGYGTGLKPSYEPILVCMKPIDGTFAENCLKWGVGGLNIDECRIPMTQSDIEINEGKASKEFVGIKPFGGNGSKGSALLPNKQGRFPSNFIHDGSQEVMELFPNTQGGGKPKTTKQGFRTQYVSGEEKDSGINSTFYGGDSGSAARFFYCAKSSKRERNMGCEDLPLQKGFGKNTSRQIRRIDPDTGEEKWFEYKPDEHYHYRNNHPTVKPLALMEYLVKLVTRPGHIVLDPFIGSGTTAMACVKLGRHYVGCELDKGYYDIAIKRIAQVGK